MTKGFYLLFVSDRESLRFFWCVYRAAAGRRCGSLAAGRRLMVAGSVSAGRRRLLDASSWRPVASVAQFKQSASVAEVVAVAVATPQRRGDGAAVGALAAFHHGGVIWRKRRRRKELYGLFFLF